MNAAQIITRIILTFIFIIYPIISVLQILLKTISLWRDIKKAGPCLYPLPIRREKNKLVMIITIISFIIVLVISIIQNSFLFIVILIFAFLFFTSQYLYIYLTIKYCGIYKDILFINDFIKYSEIINFKELNLATLEIYLNNDEKIKISSAKFKEEIKKYLEEKGIENLTTAST